MENLFGALAIVVAIMAFPGGFFVARCCTQNVFARIALTVVFGAVILAAGLVAVIAGCSGLGGKVNMH